MGCNDGPARMGGTVFFIEHVIKLHTLVREMQNLWAGHRPPLRSSKTGPANSSVEAKSPGVQGKKTPDFSPGEHVTLREGRECCYCNTAQKA